MTDIVERLRHERDEARRREREWHNASAQDRADNHRLRAALRGLLDEVMCFVVDPPSAALNHAIEEAGCALERRTKAGDLS